MNGNLDSSNQASRNIRVMPMCCCMPQIPEGGAVR
jgi:hypothetical protein